MRFTPEVRERTSAREVEQGRPLRALADRLGAAGLVDDAHRALEQLTPVEREIASEAGRWYLARVLPVGAGERIDGVVITFDDITERKRAEDALRESEARQAFLLRFSDVLRPLADSAAIQGEATHLLREHFDVGWCYYAEFNEFTTHVTVRRDATREGLPSLVGQHDVSDVPEYLDLLRTGRVVTVSDYANFPLLSARIRARYTALGVRSTLGVPLVKEGKLIAHMVMLDTAPRSWSETAVALLGEVAERTWAAVERARAEAAMRASEERFRAVADLVPDLLWQADAAGARTWGNRRWMEYTGQTYEEATDYGWTAAIHPDDREQTLRSYRAALAGGERFRHEHRLRGTDGVYRWFLAEAVPVRDHSGSITQWFGSDNDVHQERTALERLEAEVQARTQSLAESEERFRALVNASAQMVWTMDADGHAVEDSPSWRAYTGQRAEQWLKQGWADAVHPDDRGPALAEWRRTVAAAQRFEREFRVWHAPTQAWRWTAVRAVPLRDQAGQVHGWVGMNIDIEDGKRAEHQLRRMTLRLTMAEQEERRRIAQILHDDLQQVIYGIKTHAWSIHRKLHDPDAIAAHVEKIADWSDRAIETTRHLTVDLSPPILKGEGLREALCWLQGQMAHLHDLQVDLEAEHAFVIATEDLRVLIFQGIRELLFNVRKHAGVHRARVTLTQDGTDLVASVIDEGCGFATARLDATDDDSHGGFGLLSVRERMRLVGGDLCVESRPGQGTRVTLTVPIGSP